MNSLANSSVFWVALIAGLLVLYILPSLIGAIRRVEGLGWLIVINLLPTGIGWLAAMILAVMLPRREPPMTYSRPSSAYLPAYYTQGPGQRW
jgi:hypothetical protein